jgi:galactose mutarotase-like enzyme
METLTLRDVRSRVEIVPERGGIISRFWVDDAPILYLDEATLADPTKNVRGGVPVLFPQPGKLAGDAFHYGGRRGQLAQHGLARNLPWAIVSRDERQAVLELRSDEASRARYPWSFALRASITLAGARLRIEQRVTNLDDAPMPFGLGLHPYFYLPDADKAAARIETAATRAFDNVSKQIVPLHGIDLTQPEVDLHLIDHGTTHGVLRTPRGQVRVEASAEYVRWVVWTLRGRDFVCLEPWTCPADALNTGDGLNVLPAGASRDLWVSIEVQTQHGPSAQRS